MQRIRRSTREADRDGVQVEDGDRGISPACVNACPTTSLTFGDFNDETSQVSIMKEEAMSNRGKKDGRGYRLLDNLGTEANVIYLKKVDESVGAVHGH